MSTKTLRKRIALVAVSAMGFGLLTSVGAHASEISASNSVGLVGPKKGFSTTPLAQTATLLNTGTLKLTTGKIVTISAGAAITDGGTINGSQTCTSGATDVSIVPTGAVGTQFTVTVYDTGTDCATGDAATPIEIINVTIAGSSQAGTPSASNSTAAWVDYNSGSPDLTKTKDVADKNTALRGGTLALAIHVKDIYKGDIDKAGALTAVVSDGAVVSFTSTKGTYTTAVSSSAVAGSTGVFVRIDEKTKGTGWNGTATISYNGTVIATKSGKITGDVTKITTSLHKVADKKASPANTEDVIRYQAYDSAGNIVALLSPDTGLLKDSSSNSAVVSAITASATANKTDGTSGKVGVTCSDKGSSDVVLYYVNEAGTIVKSNATKVLCGGDAYSYTASFDKSTYKQGDIAKLTVKFLDSKGNAANSVTSVSDATTADQVVTAPQMVRVTDAGGYSKDLKVDETGAVVYTFTVGTDSGIVAGTYNAVVSFPTVNTNGAGENQSVTYTITSGGTSISNAEVLAAIVKLIASINKQITALQKLLTKKK